MKASELRRLAAAVRASGERLHGRKADAVIETLGAVLARWREPASPERRRLERELPAHTGLHPETLRRGLELGLAPWSPEAWRDLARRELGSEPGRGAPLTAVLLGGALPLPTLLSVIAPLAVRSPALVRPGSRDPLTASAVEASLAAIDPELAACVGITQFPRDDEAALAAFLEADCVVATGSDRAMEAVAGRLAPGRRLVRHGHAVSLALLGAGAHGQPEPLRRAARGLALDTALWDQQGCLSPQVVFVAGDTAACRRVAEALGAALDELASRLPRGRVPAEARALIEHEHSAAELRQAAGSGTRLLAGADWTVVCEPDATPRAHPLYRFLRVQPLAEARLEQELSPWRPWLAGIALAGYGPGAPALRARLKKLGATRVCEPGSLQAPPLDWPRDRQPVLASLLSPQPPPTP